MAKKPVAIDKIETDADYAAANTLLSVLKTGLDDIQREANAQRIEAYLGNAANHQAPANRKVGSVVRRSDLLRVRLKQLRGVPKKSDSTTAPVDSHPAVSAALALLQSESQPARLSRRQSIAQLEDNSMIIRDGIMAQTAVVEAIRSALSGTLAQRLREQHRAMVLAQYRAAQSLAAASDDLLNFRSSVLAAGFEFHSDVMPEPILRSALILGSESDDSEISRTRLLLEKLGILA